MTEILPELLEQSFHREQWLLEEGLTYLNHGSFGACPKPLLQKQREFQEQLERHPVRFFLAESPTLLHNARESLATFVGAQPDDIALLPNATTAVNTVLRSIHWKPGEQLLATDHTYNACRNALEFVAERWGVEVVVAPIPFPQSSPQAVIDSVLSKVTERTRFALLDAITSSTALVLPYDTLTKELEGRGIETMVDGAHAPGMIPLDLDSLGASYFTGNCHKWLCAPKGVAFLHTRADKQEYIRPLVISHGANEPLRGRSRYNVEFNWQGTSDITPLLCLPHVLAWGEDALEGGWPAIRERNRALVLEGRRILCEALDVEPPAPAEMIGTIATIPLPDAEMRENVSAFDIDPVQAALLREYNIEVPIFLWPKMPTRWLRISAQLYNNLDEYKRLAQGLVTLLNQ